MKFEPATYLLLSIIIMLAAAGVFAPWISPHDPIRANFDKSLQRPSIEHPLGTDILGRDVLSRVIFGSRTAFTLTALSMGLAILVGGGLGVVGGYLGGRVDLGVSAILDFLYSFPLILLSLYIMASFGRTVWALVFATGLGVAPILGRVIRAEVIRIRKSEYVQASITLGGSQLHILRKHILPNIAPVMVVLITTTSVYALLIEASLSFLGLSLPPPAPTWGSIVAEGRANLLSAPWISLAGGAAISILVVTLNLLGDRLRDLMEADGSIGNE